MKKLYVSVLFLLAVFTVFPQGRPGTSESGVFHRVRESDIPSQNHNFSLIQIADSLNQPWALAFLPDGRYLITERSGNLVILGPQGRTRVQGIPGVASVGQGGLLDILLDPDFEENSTVYFTYASGSGGSLGTSIGSGRLDESTTPPRLVDVRVLWQTPRQFLSGGGQHFGSRVVFGPDGYLYFTIGDRGTMERAQNPGDPAGSVLRIRPDGGIPQSNPFMNTTTINARNQVVTPLPEVFAYGTRNAQGLAIDWNNRVWLHEHGPRGGDEINLVEPGANYGWPAVTFGVNYSGTRISSETTLPGIKDPVLHWTPSIAPSGFVFYTGDLFPEWKTSAFVGALAGQHLRRVQFEGESVVQEEVLLQNAIGRIRDVRVGPSGHIYILSDGTGASLFRLEPMN